MMKFREPVYLVLIAFLMGWILIENQGHQISEQADRDINKTFLDDRVSENSSEAAHSVEAVDQSITDLGIIVDEVEVTLAQKNTPSNVESFNSLDRQIVDLSELPQLTIESNLPISSEDESTLTYQMEDDLTYLIASLSELDMEAQEILMPRSGEKISEYINRVDTTIGIEKFEELTTKYIEDMNPDIQRTP